MNGRGESNPRWEWAATALVLAIPWVVVSVCFWPGHMNADTLYQLQQVRTGDITNKHSPVLQWIWSLVWPLGIGAGWALSATALTFVIGSFLVLRSMLRPLAAASAASVIALTPQLLGYLGTVTRDTWFAALLLLSFGLLVEASKREGRGRVALLVAALAAAWLCVATRQNAGGAMFVAFGVGAVLALPWAPRIRGIWSGWGWALRVVAAGSAGLAICLGCIGSQLLLNEAVGVRSDAPEEFLYEADLKGIADHKGEKVGEVTRTSWWASIRDDPATYLDTRADLLLDNLGVTRTAQVVYHPGIDPNDQRFVLKNPEEDEVAVDYLALFSNDDLDGTIIHRVWIYLAVCVLAAFVFIRPGRPPPLVVAGSLGLAMLSFQLGHFFTLIIAQYRFEYVTVAAGAVLGVLLACFALFERYPRLRAALGVS
ncbi:MAG: hypothetical protein EXQ70_07410 [Solirubrobacterales bacterium]|nr:hypothetical protein [Solirubrobacterales bacterium]